MNCKNCEYGLKQCCGDFEKILCTYEEGECVKIAELEKACEETQELLDKQIEATYKLDKENAELKKENTLAESLLYCTKKTCDNCGFVNCENFQRQRKSKPCSLYISYQDRIKNLAHENDVLMKKL